MKEPPVDETENSARSAKPGQVKNNLPEQQTLTVQQALDFALEHHTAGRLAQAESIYRRILQSEPKQPFALHLLGVIAHQEGKNDVAVDLITKALAIEPGVAEFHNNLGLVLQEQGKLEEAVIVFHRAVGLDPRYPDAQFNLGNVLNALGRVEDAITAFRRALELRPDYLEASNNLAATLLEGFKLDDAIATYRRALELNSDDPDLNNNLGVALKQQGAFEEALVPLRRSIELRPDNPGAYKNLSNIFQELNRPEEAREALGHAYRIAPEPGIEFRAAMVFPMIPESAESIAQVRADYTERLEIIRQKGLTLENPYLEVATTPFLLAYHGENNLELQKSLAQIYLKACPSLAWTASHCAQKRREKVKSKINVGFISTFFWRQSVGIVTNGIIANLPRNSMSITMLFAQKKWDEISTFAERHADRAVTVPMNLDAARETIAKEELDILVYTDIGMDPFTYFLAFSRLAPVQCVMLGHPVTTGIPAIDYFISSEFLDTADSDEQYSETLVRLKGLPYYYSRPRLPASPKSKAALGLPKTGTLYVCPMLLHKIHPTFDEAIAAILRRDLSGKIIFFQADRASALHEALLARYHKTMVDVIDRICFLPFAPQEDFLSILMQCDVALDNFGLTGGTTILQVLATGLPIVTWPSATYHGRWTYTFYRTMDLMDCVVSSLDDYVDLAVRLGADRALRDRIRSTILQRNSAVYENPVMLDAMAEFFESPPVTGRNGR